MSIRVIDLVWRTFPGAGSELLAMLALADWCNDEGDRLYPSINAVAKRIRKSHSQARRVVHKLIADEWLSVVGNEFGGAPGTTRQYQLNVTKLTRTRCVDATPRTDAQDGLHKHSNTTGMGASQAVIGSVKEPSVKEQVHSRGSRLPQEWQPSIAELAWARAKRVDLDVQEEADKFRDYWHSKAGKDAAKVNWTAAWQYWIRNARALSARTVTPVRSTKHGGFEERAYGEGGLL